MAKYYVREYDTYNNQRDKLQIVKVYPEEPKKFDYIIRVDKGRK